MLKNRTRTTHSCRFGLTLTALLWTFSFHCFATTANTPKENTQPFGLDFLFIGMSFDQAQAAIKAKGFPVVRNTDGAVTISVQVKPDSQEIFIDLERDSGQLSLVALTVNGKSAYDGWINRLKVQFGRPTRFEVGSGGRTQYCLSRNFYIETSYDTWKRRGRLAYRYNPVRSFELCDAVTVVRLGEPFFAFQGEGPVPTAVSANVNPTVASTAERPFLFDEPESNFNPDLPSDVRSTLIRDRIRRAAVKYHEVLAPYITKYSEDVGEHPPAWVMERYFKYHINKPTVTPELRAKAHYFRGLVDQNFLPAERTADPAASWEQCARLMKNRNCALMYNYVLAQALKEPDRQLLAQTNPLSSDEMRVIKDVVDSIYSSFLQNEPITKFDSRDAACLKIRAEPTYESVFEGDDCFAMDNNGKCMPGGRYVSVVTGETYSTKNTCDRVIRFSWSCTKSGPRIMLPGDVFNGAIGDKAPDAKGCYFEKSFRAFDYK